MVGPRAASGVMLALFLSLATWPSSASTLEDANHAISYQFDGQTGHDAPDTCERAADAWALPIGNRTDGLLVPPDDMSDVFVMDVAPHQVGMRIDLRLAEATASIDLGLAAFAPACDGDVFAPHNRPVPFPTPPAPAGGERQATLGRNAQGVYCGDGWIFVATDLDGHAAPASMHAAYTDGTEATIPLAFSNPQVAVYMAAGPLAATLTGAWINLPAHTTGDFVLAKDPCGNVDQGAVYGDPPLLSGDRLGFTPIRAGRHLVQVGLGPAGVEGPPSSVPLSCHLCFGEVEQAASKGSYSLSATALVPGNLP